MWPGRDASRRELFDDQRYPLRSRRAIGLPYPRPRRDLRQRPATDRPYGIGIGKPWQVQQSTGGPFVGAGSCFYWLHTHTDDGIIHIESPVQRTFTLGDFFAIWGQPLSSSQAASATGPVIAYVNGELSSGDPSQITLRAHELIQLDVGDETPPQPFTFPPGL